MLGEDGRPAGVLSDFDLLAGEWLADDAEGLRAMQDVTAAELMSSPVETIGASEAAGAAAAKLRELHVSRLLVTDDGGSAVGVIAVSDLVAPLGSPSGARETVRDVMSQAIVTCPPETTLPAAARAMTERHSRSIVVVDDGGGAIGIVTGNDLLALYEGDPAATVADLMSSPITCGAALSLSDAADLMIGNEVHRLVVTTDTGPPATPIGVVSTADIVAEMAARRSVWQRGR